MSRRCSSAVAFLVLAILAPIAAEAANVDRTTPTITRAEAVALLVSSQTNLRSRVERLQNRMPPLPLFADAPKTAWFAPYVEVAFAQGWIRGNVSRAFRPNDPLKTEEALALVTRMKRSIATERILYLPGSEDRWIREPLEAALSEGIPVRLPLTIGQGVTRKDFYAMLGAVNIFYPDTIAFVEPPSPPPAPAPRRIALQPQRARSTAPLRRGTEIVSAQGQTVGMGFSVSLPTLGINDLPVIHPSDPFSSNGLLAPLKNGVGHLFSYPGTEGKILIYGHSSGYPWDSSNYTKIFRQINRLNPGDRVTVLYNGTTHVYEVTYKETVPAQDMNAYRNGGSEELILYTCWPPDSIKERYLVHAKPVEKIAAR